MISKPQSGNDPVMLTAMVQRNNALTMARPEEAPPGTTTGGIPRPYDNAIAIVATGGEEAQKAEHT